MRPSSRSCRGHRPIQTLLVLNYVPLHRVPAGEERRQSSEERSVSSLQAEVASRGGSLHSTVDRGPATQSCEHFESESMHHFIFPSFFFPSLLVGLWCCITVVLLTFLYLAHCTFIVEHGQRKKADVRYRGNKGGFICSLSHF